MSSLGEIAKKSIKEKGLPLIEEAKTKLPLYVSVRELPLRFQFGTAKIQKFFKGLREGKVYMTQCEKCGEKDRPKRCIFHHCKYSFEGTLKDNSEVQSGKGVANGEFKITSANQVEWHHLTITAERLPAK